MENMKNIKNIKKILKTYISRGREVGRARGRPQTRKMSKT